MSDLILTIRGTCRLLLPIGRLRCVCFQCLTGHALLEPCATQTARLGVLSPIEQIHCWAPTGEFYALATGACPWCGLLSAVRLGAQLPARLHAAHKASEQAQLQNRAESDRAELYGHHTLTIRLIDSLHWQPRRTAKSRAHVHERPPAAKTFPDTTQCSLMLKARRLSAYPQTPQRLEELAAAPLAAFVASPPPLMP